MSEADYQDLPVQGYLFQSVAEGSDLARYNECVCKILRRATASEFSENETLANGPAFMVKFGDGRTEVAYAHELSPWYPTD